MTSLKSSRCVYHFHFRLHLQTKQIWFVSVMFYGFYFCASIQVYLIDVLLFSFLKSVNWGLHCIAIRNAFLMLLELGIVFCQHIN